MPAYRFYDLTPPDPDLMCQGAFFSDGAAMTWAFRQAGPGGIEVWQGDRFVGRLHGPHVGAAERKSPAGDP